MRILPTVLVALVWLVLCIESATTQPEPRSVGNPQPAPSSNQPLTCSGIVDSQQETGSSRPAHSMLRAWPDSHKSLEIEGWTVLVSQQLLEQDKKATDRALVLLTRQLHEIRQVVPAAAAAELQRVPLWISPEYPDFSPRAEYHPDARWLRDNNRDPAMEKAVEFTNVSIFEQETRRMPNFALHELAHAYHDRVLPGGFGNQPVKAAYEKARAAGLYESVEQRFGDGRSASVRAYALTDPQEYFAECTEAFFSTNDFFPFTRDQLARYDPGMFEELKKLWGETADREAVGRPSIQDADRLTLDRIFVSDDFRADPLPPRQWLENGSYITLSPSATWEDASDLVRVNSSAKEEVLVPAEKLVPPGAGKPLVVEGFDFSPDFDVVLIYTNSVKVWRQNTRGDYWTFRRSTQKLARLGGDALPSTLMFAKLSPDGTRVGYVRENNLFVEPADGGQPATLAGDGSPQVINGTFDWVYEEEFDCRDGWRWSPDGQQIAYWQLDTTGVKTFTLVDYTTDSYPILKTFAYPKTGEQNSACRIGVVAATGGQTNWISIPGDTRTGFYLPRMEWANNSRELVIQRVHRIQNTVDVMLADAKSGAARIVLTERDDAWVDLHDGAVEWAENGGSFTWISERDGWRHLYLASRDGTTIRQITRGEFDIIRVLRVDEKAGQAWFLASPENPTRQYLYCVSLDGTGEPRRISPAHQPGTHDYDLSPDGTVAVHTWSNINHPPQVELVSLPDHKRRDTIAPNDRLRQAVGQLQLPPVEFLRTDIGGDVILDGWLIKPPGFDPSAKYPLMLHVYGEPASQSVRDLWGGRHFLWHRLLAQQGYVVVCFDNRGTPCPRGRAWRKAAFKRVGSLASADQAAATRELLKQPWLDSSRVGVWGWSGGGSMTLNLMFRYPDLFQTGIAIASVPDMRLYDTIYQERYMGLPQENAEAYADGSPITHAAGLKGNLLIVHGSGDDNCHEQGMNRLVNRLIELNRDFSMMSYPNRSHSLNEGANTTRHLYGLMTRYLNDHLPAGAR
jgi:dipeptidyl-peptidase 4